MEPAKGAFAAVRRWLAERDRNLFIDRELLLRSESRVQHLRIARRHQRLVTAGGVVLTGWLLYATLSYFLSPYLLRAREEALDLERQAQVVLTQRVADYETQLGLLAAGLQHYREDLRRQAQAAAAVARAGSAEEIALLRESLAAEAMRRASLEEAQRQTEARRSLAEEQLSASESERRALQSALSGQEELLRRLALVEAERDMAVAEAGGLRAALASSEEEATDLADRLAASETLRGAAELRAAGLAEALSESEALLAASEADRALLSETQVAILEELDAGDDERGRLAGRLGLLEKDLAQAAWRSTALGSKVNELEAALATVETAKAAVESERAHLDGRLVALEATLTSMRDQQHELVTRMEVRTVDSIGDLETLVAATGLDVEDRLRHAAGNDAQGGPFIPVDDLLASGEAYELQISVAMLDLRLDRWEQLQRLAGALPLLAPLKEYEITSDFGYRRDPINGRRALHSGVDFRAPRNTPLYTTASGVVTFAGWRGRYGRVVEIDHGFGIKTRFAHLAKISVKKGESVDLGEEIGLLGASGRATGPHCHYEILVDGKPYDPMNFIKAGKDVL